MQQLDAANLAADVASVDAHLDMLRPAIASYGAKVEVRSSNSTALTHLTRCLAEAVAEVYMCMVSFMSHVPV